MEIKNICNNFVNINCNISWLPMKQKLIRNITRNFVCFYPGRHYLRVMNIALCRKFLVFVAKCNYVAPMSQSWQNAFVLLIHKERRRSGSGSSPRKDVTMREMCGSYDTGLCHAKSSPLGFILRNKKKNSTKIWNHFLSILLIVLLLKVYLVYSFQSLL